MEPAGRYGGLLKKGIFRPRKGKLLEKNVPAGYIYSWDMVPDRRPPDCGEAVSDMRRKWMKIVPCLIVAAIGMLAPAAGAMPGHHPREGARPGRMPLCGDPVFLKEKLRLTDMQIGQVEKINARFKKDLQLLREKLRPMRDLLMQMLLAEKVDLAGVRVMLQNISAVEVEIHLTMIRHRLEIEKVLTDGQKKTLREERMRGCERDE